MLSKFVRIQLIVFAVITVFSVGWVGVKYVNVGRLLGLGSFPVTANLTSTGGLYSNSIVTYNGVQVGYVDDVEPWRYGIKAKLQIYNGTEIPSDLVAEVHSTSAVGEQYIDLKPRTSSGPILASGSEIRENQTTLPTSTNDLLNSVDKFVATVPRDSYRTVVDELATATNGSGPALHSLVTGTRGLLSQARDNLNPTIGLIDVFSPVLGTQRDLGPEIQNSVSKLALFTDQLAASDSHLRSVLDNGSSATRAVDRFVRDLDDPLPHLLASLTDDSEVLRVYIPNLRQALVLVPPTLSAIQAVLAPYQDLHAVKLNFRANVDDPPYCHYGYKQLGRDPSDLTNQPQLDGVYCKAPPDSQEDVRGVRNNPCPNSSARSADPAGCGLHFQRPSKPIPPWPDDSVSTYDPLSGDFTDPDGKPWTLPLLGRNAARPSASDLKSFLLWPVK